MAKMNPAVERLMKERVAQRQAAQDGKVFNPERDPEAIAKDAAVVARENRPQSTMAATGKGLRKEEASLQWSEPAHDDGPGLHGPRRRNASQEAEDEEGQEGQDENGDGRVQAGEPSLGEQARPEGEEPGSGHRDRTEPVGPVPEETTARPRFEVFTFEAESKAAVDQKIALDKTMKVVSIVYEKYVRAIVTVRR